MPDAPPGAKAAESPKPLAGIAPGTSKAEPPRAPPKEAEKDERAGERKIVVYVDERAGQAWDDFLAREHLEPQEALERAIDDLENVDSEAVDTELKARIGKGAFVAPCRKCGELGYESAEGDRELERRAKYFEHKRCGGAPKPGERK